MGLGDWLLNLPYDRGPLSPFASRYNPLMGLLGPQPATAPRLAAQESALMEEAPWMVGYEGLPAPSVPAPEAPVAMPVQRQYLEVPGELPPRGPTNDPQILSEQLRHYWYEPFAAAAGEGLPYDEGGVPKKKKKKKREE